ncbi:cation transporter [Flavobacterium sp.]|uniref:cation transporter n=1 Tax=Flavobacterium sp. TaxID=239 RepID=UPI0039E5A576
MKNVRTILMLLLVLTAANAFAQKKTEKAVIQTALYCDHCKACETCGQLFQKNMLKIKGVKMYELDEKAMTITVYYDPKKTNLETIKTGISQLGFDADDFKADALAYEKLDGCCKKSE